MFHDKEREIRDSRTAGNRRHVLSSMLRAAPVAQSGIGGASKKTPPDDSIPPPPDLYPPVLPSARLFDRHAGSVPQIRPVTRGRKSATNARHTVTHSVSARDGITDVSEQAPNSALAKHFHGGGQPSPRFVFQGATALSQFTLVGTSHGAVRALASQSHFKGRHDGAQRTASLVPPLGSNGSDLTTTSAVESSAYASKGKQAPSLSGGVGVYPPQEHVSDTIFTMNRDAYAEIARPQVRQKDPTQSLDLFPRVAPSSGSDVLASSAGNTIANGWLHSGGVEGSVSAAGGASVSAQRRRSSSSSANNNNKNAKVLKQSSDVSGGSTESDDDPFPPCSPPAVVGATKHTSTPRVRGTSTTSSARRRSAQPNVADADAFDDPFPTKKTSKKKIPIIVEEEWEGVWAMPTSAALAESNASAPTILSLFTAPPVSSLTDTSALPSPQNHSQPRAPSVTAAPIPTPPARRSSELGRVFSERRLRTSSLRDEQVPVDHVVVEDMCEPSPSASRIPPPSAGSCAPLGAPTGSFRRRTQGV